MFYLLSLKRTKESDRVLTWWGPDEKGYTFRLEGAGQYTEEHIARDLSRLDNGHNVAAIPCEAVDAKAVAVGTVKSNAIERKRPETDRVVPWRFLKPLLRRRRRPDFVDGGQLAVFLGLEAAR